MDYVTTTERADQKSRLTFTAAKLYYPADRGQHHRFIDDIGRYEEINHDFYRWQLKLPLLPPTPRRHRFSRYRRQIFMRIIGYTQQRKSGPIVGIYRYLVSVKRKSAVYFVYGEAVRVSEYNRLARYSIFTMSEHVNHL